MITRDPQVLVEREMLHLLDHPDQLAPVIEKYLDDDQGFDALLDAVSGLCVGGDILPKLNELRECIAWQEGERIISAHSEEDPYIEY